MMHVLLCKHFLPPELVVSSIAIHVGERQFSSVDQAEIDNGVVFVCTEIDR